MSENDDERDEARGPGGMDAIPDDPLDDSDEPGGMSGIPEGDAPAREGHETDD